MYKRIAVVGTACCVALGVALAWTTHQSSPKPGTQQGSEMMSTSPARGYDVHVLAPQLVEGKQMGPYHHYCKTYTNDPVIVCLIYESTDANAMLAQVEWIWAKKLVRNHVDLKTWNKNWHDHAIEIAGGRVKVLDLPEDKAKEVADLVSTTDGQIYHFYFNDGIPNAKVTVAQAVGHKPMSAEEWKNYEKK
jgi:hypothetical protein